MRAKDAGSVRSIATDATEDARSRRQTRPDGTALHSETSSKAGALGRTLRVDWLNRLYRLISLALVVTVLLFWALVLRPVSLGGPAGYVLVSGTSMNPLYHTGDLVLVERHSDYHVGDIVAYHVPKGDPMAGAQVIHRIIGGNAASGWIVQGDNRSAPDVWRPHDSDIVGSAALHVPNAVVVLQWLRSPVLMALLAACFVFARVIGRSDDEDGGDPKDAA